MPDLCPPCSREWMAWLDYRLPPPPVGLVSIGGRNKVREVADRREARYRTWRETVRFQQGLIEGSCPGAGHYGEAGPPLVELVKVAGGLL